MKGNIIIIAFIWVIAILLFLYTLIQWSFETDQTRIGTAANANNTKNAGGSATFK